MYQNKIINVDTDAILICKPDGAEFGDEEQYAFIKELNAQFPDKINFDHDGYYESVVVVKTKNYATLLKGETKIKTKGSSIRDQKKEPALREMMDKIIYALTYHKTETIHDIYMSYVTEALNVTDMARWAQKKGVTEAITNCEGVVADTIEVTNEKGEVRDKLVYRKNGKVTDIRSNEVVVWNAIKDEEIIQQGDKYYLYSTAVVKEVQKTTLKNGKVKEKIIYEYGLSQVKFWDAEAPNHDKEHLLKRLYSTLEIFKFVLDMEQFKNYSLVKNYKELIDEKL